MSPRYWWRFQLALLGQRHSNRRTGQGQEVQFAIHGDVLQVVSYADVTLPIGRLSHRPRHPLNHRFRHLPSLTAAELAKLASITDAADRINAYMEALRAIAAGGLPPPVQQQVPLAPVSQPGGIAATHHTSLIGTAPMQQAQPVQRPASALDLARYRVADAAPAIKADGA